MRGSILIWLALGMGLRMLLLFQPPVEDNSWIRQTQTADAIQSWVDAGHPTWDAKASWRGDTGARLAQELPVFNFLVYLGAWAGLPLNVAGRLVSALLWGAGFLVLQMIWRRWLDGRATFWANLLFVLSPVSVAFGQAIMPEMLVQLLGLVWVVLLLRYRDQPSPVLWWGIVAVGALGSMIKLPAFSHYYLMLGLALFLRHWWGVFAQPRVWAGGIFTVAILWWWSRYTQSVNSAYFPEWTATANLEGFLGHWQERLDPAYWIRLFFYLFVLVGTPAAWLAMLLAGTREGKSWLQLPLLAPWLAGLGMMILLWGPRTCMGHAYYCLPFLAPVCAIFGKSVATLLSQKHFRTWPAFLLATGVLVGCLSMACYLLRPDRTLREATEWMKKNIPPTDLVIIKANHSDYTREYPQLSGFSYLSGRRVWVWTPYLTWDERERAVKSSRWILETHPPILISWWEELRRKIKRHHREVENIDILINRMKGEEIINTRAFTVYFSRQVKPND